MKKCPACDKTFEDSMRFCQVDGTLLVDDAPAFDPYATIVAQPKIPAEQEEPSVGDAPVAEAVAPAEETAPEPDMNYTVGSIPIGEPEDVLDLPENDPLKTLYVSDSEMRSVLGTEEPAAEFIEIPPIEEASQPEPPSFIAPEAASPPPSPFSMSESVADEPEPAPPVFEDPAPASPMFDEAATMIQPSFNSPFDPAPPAPMAEWTPPPAPDASWQNQEIGANTPFQPPPGATGPSSILAIVSLILGIIGLLSVIPTLIFIFCGILPFFLGIGAAITGFLARSRAGSSPDQYGGKGMATIGIVLGVLDVIAPFGVVILTVLLWGGLAALGSMPR